MNLLSTSVFLITMLLGFSIIIAFALIIRNYNSNKSLTIFLIALSLFIFNYSIVPLFFIHFFENETPAKYEVFFTDKVGVIYSLIILVSIIIFAFFYKIGKKIKMNFRVKLNFIDYKHTFTIAILLFSIGLFGLLIDINLQGGLRASFNSIELIRGFKSSEVKDGSNNPLVFFRLLKMLLLVSFYLFLFISLENKNVNYKILVWLNGILVLYLLFINGGRLHLILFIFTLIPVLLKKSNRNSLKRNIILISSILMAIFFLSVLDPLFKYLTYGTIPENLGFNLPQLVQQFSFPSSNMFFVLGNNEIQYRFFIDLIIWVQSIMPSFLLNMIGITEVSPLYEINTISQNGTLLQGGIPTDILTFGFYQLGYIGVLIIISMTGLLFGILDKFLSKFNENSIKPIVLRVQIYFGIIVMYADLEPIIKSKYDFLLLPVFLLVIRKYYIQKRSGN